MANINAGAYIGFRTGTQATVNGMLANGTGAVHGTFYLAADTHRLYIGNSDGTLSPVNEGLTTVTRVADLPNPSNDSDWVALQGQFYYCTNENILCVASGRRWVQINPDTYLEATDSSASAPYKAVDVAAGANDANNATITTLVRDTGGRQNHSATGNFVLQGSANVTVSVTDNVITLTSPNGEVYTFEGQYHNGSNNDDGVDLVLDGSASQPQIITFKADSDSDIVPKWDATNNAILLSGGNGIKGATISITGDNSTGAVTVNLKDTKNHQTQTVFTPIITIGEDDEEVKFVYDSNSKTFTADLDVYTKTEIDDLITSNLQSFEAMYFAGTIGESNATSTLSGLTSLTGVKNGATFKFIEAYSTIPTSIRSKFDNLPGDNKIEVGDMVIITGTEDSDGEVDMSTATYHYIPSGDDVDEYFTPTLGASGTHKISFTKHSDGSTTELVFAAGTQAAVTSTAVTGSGSTQTKTITIAHGTITQSADEELTAINGNSNGGAPTYEAIVGLTVDNGHVTKIQTQKLNLFSNKLVRVETTATADANTGTIKVANDYIDSLNTHTEKKNDWEISSQSLQLSVGAAGSMPATGTGTTANITVDLVWGSF